MKRIVYGIHAVRALQAKARRIDTLHLLPSLKLRPEFEQLAIDCGARIELGNREVLDALAGSRHHQGVVAELRSMPDYNEDWLESSFATPSEDSLLLALDGVEDPRNLGACVRTAAAAGVDAVILPKSRGTRMTPVAEKVASGGAERVPVVLVSNLVRRLNWFRNQGLQVIGADSGAATLWHQADYQSPSVLVVGSEGRGLRKLTRETCDALVSLPIDRSMQSLNVSVATGVLLYEVLRQRPCGL